MGHGANGDPIRADVNRAFSADLPDFSAPGALPRLAVKTAPLALNEQRKPLPASQNCFASQAGVSLS
jgi:hypothetical protein